MAVPPGAQARRQAAGRLAIRLPHLHRKSGSAKRYYDFACDLRALVARQSLPGYVLGIERMPDNGWSC
jgi:plasmid replication initiation protein